MSYSKFVYFVGHIRALWHKPQSLGFFLCVVVFSVVSTGTGECSGESSSSISLFGKGQVLFLKESGQNSLILLYRYHCRCMVN